ncbi:MAG: 2-C-methyl-D-erythritol 4-phosphate cytidylyltransferase [Burkholderiaceae bacterium]|nr:2-C-methyl-D-erythritol 4-phosphate cytidylyltransferase [Burkholderiaceae bacterium]
MSDRLFGLIPAAGTGSRMGAMVPKQYARLGAQTMLEHAIDALLSVPDVEHVLVVVAPGDIVHRQLAPRARTTFAAVGGPTRADSVRNGLQALRAQVGLGADDWVLVHDAARPCLAREELSRLIVQVVDDAVGGLLALPVADTLKRGDHGRVEETVPRDCLWRALTPQMFRAGVLTQALAAACGEGAPTDEAAAVERLKLRPRLVEGFATNIKVTVPSDWALAEAILRAQGRLA